MYKDEHYHLKQQKPISDYLSLEPLQDQNDETKLLLSIFLPKCKRNPRQGILRPTSFTHLAYLTDYIVHILVIHKHRKNCTIVLILSTGSKSAYAILTNVMSQTVLSIFSCMHIPNVTDQYNVFPPYSVPNNQPSETTSRCW